MMRWFISQRTFVDARSALLFLYMETFIAGDQTTFGSQVFHLMVKLYQSEKWLRRKYITERLTETEIAELCGATQVTINRYLKKFGLRK